MIRKFVRSLGFDIVRYPYKFNKINVGRLNMVRLLRSHQIDLVLDVGANIGQFGKDLRIEGFDGQIVSFEPLKDSFRTLNEVTKNDDRWSVRNYALGERDQTATINVAGNSMSSSLLAMNSIHEMVAPTSKYIATEQILVKSLDSVFDEFANYKSIYLKIDVQGYESSVLRGASKNLHRISGIQLEMSLVELYAGESTFFDMSSFIIERGFKLRSIIPGLFDKATGQLLQLDGIWYRK